MTSAGLASHHSTAAGREMKEKFELTIGGIGDRRYENPRACLRLHMRGAWFMRRYEMIYIINPNLDTESLGEVVDKFSDIITRLKGYVVKINQWGKTKGTVWSFTTIGGPPPP